MHTFTFEIALFSTSNDEKKPLETFTGEISALKMGDARAKVWPVIMKRVHELEAQRGVMVGCGNLLLSLKPEDQANTTTISLSEYLQSVDEGHSTFDPNTTIISMPLSFWLEYEQRWLNYKRNVEDAVVGIQALFKGGVRWTISREAKR